MSNNDKKYWKGLEELREEPKFIESKSREFFEELPLLPTLQSSRRDFLKLLGFSFAGTALAACSRMPVEKAIPYLIQPEDVVPGVPNWYATACSGCTAACGLLVKTRDGRPIKIEGNAELPLTSGGVCAVGQASVLSLYDDARLKGPIVDGKNASWEEVDRLVSQELGEISGAGGKIVLLTGTVVSPSLMALIEEWLKKYPTAEHVSYDAMSVSALLDAQEAAYGRRILPRYLFDKAKVIVGFNCDFLGTWISPVEFTRAYAGRRQPDGEVFLRHIQYESGMSLTGANADLRIPINPSEELKTLTGLLNEFTTQKISSKTAKELWAARGQSIVVSGTNDLSIQIAVAAINDLLGNVGKTIDLDNHSLQRQGNDQAFARFREDARQGRVAGLILYGANPVYDTPGGDELAAAIRKIRLSVSFSERLDETSSVCRIVAPEGHALETWSDAQPNTFTYLIQQPVIRPLQNVRPASESLLRWMGRTETAYDWVKGYWSQHLSNFPWDHCVRNGFITVMPQESTAPTFRPDALGKITPATAPAGLELALYQTVGLRDGRHANNPWLQELPDPVTKITWDNYASLAPAKAKALGLEDGEVVVVKSDRGSVEVPVHLQPGQAENAVSMAVGYGRTRCGKAGEKVGTNVYPLMGSAGVTISKTGRSIELAATQTHHSMEGRPIVKEINLGEPHEEKEKKETGEENVSLWAAKEYAGSLWGMAIDLSACTGCSACVISCQSENNVPVVGRDEVLRRREMHWIRIDRYYAGSEESPETVHQPMMCQHCQNAPCETVCPVLATVHSSDGLNQQVYNRCVGTRYCANNCPYKVRRFNWFDYAHNDQFDFNMNNALGAMVLNPDIVVRSRGVMEKCSMCVQRIQEKKLDAKKAGSPLKDGEIKTACQQSCPANAITFGDLNDPNSRIAQLNKDKRFYHVLEELNVKPNVGYLAKVRNKPS